MFLVSKLYWIAAQPLSLAFLLIVLSLVAMFVRLRRTGVFFSLMSALVLFVTLYTTAGAVLLQTLEARFSRPAAEPADLRCMIVLGGGVETDVTTVRGGYEFNQGGDRFVEALRLARLYPSSRILISGGDGSISGQLEGDAVVMHRFFPAFGIDLSRLIEEPDSRTTFENVVNTKALMEKDGLNDCVMITSAFHMPRSVGIFRKNGLQVVPWPTDYRTAGNVTLGFDFSQPSANSQLMTMALREWTGLLAYYLVGRTSELYPAPAA